MNQKRICVIINNKGKCKVMAYKDFECDWGSTNRTFLLTCKTDDRFSGAGVVQQLSLAVSLYFL